MSVTLNHTIVWCRDKNASARYLTGILGLGDARPWGPFMSRTTGRPPGSAAKARSTTTTAVAGCISRIPTGISSRSSLAPTGQEACLHKRFRVLLDVTAPGGLS